MAKSELSAVSDATDVRRRDAGSFKSLKSDVRGKCSPDLCTENCIRAQSSS